MYSQFITLEEALRRKKFRNRLLYYVGVPLLAILVGAVVAIAGNSAL